MIVDARDMGDVRALERTRVLVPGTTNLRDLGGYPTRRGPVRAGRLFRGEALARPGPTVARIAVWADEHVGAYRALGLRTVLDLRAPAEVALAPSAWAAASGADLVLLPIQEGGEGDATDYVSQLRAGTLRSFSDQDLADYYARTVRRRATTFGQAITALAGEDKLPALIHCTAGKDRTGILVALILESLGVPRELVVADYALTGHLRPNRVAAYADLLATHGIEPTAVSALFGSPPLAMANLLAGIDAEFGSVEAFLVARAGVDHATIGTLMNGLAR